MSFPPNNKDRNLMANGKSKTKATMMGHVIHRIPKIVRQKSPKYPYLKESNVASLITNLKKFCTYEILDVTLYLLKIIYNLVKSTN
jgi:hypothetical protein